MLSSHVLSICKGYSADLNGSTEHVAGWMNQENNRNVRCHGCHLAAPSNQILKVPTLSELSIGKHKH